MKAFRLSILTLASSASIVVALPAVMERSLVPLPDHAADAGPVLENREIHPSCVISLASCLVGYGLTHFEYQKSYIKHIYDRGWILCASAAILKGSCKDGIGNQVRSEPGQIFSWHREHGLTDDKLSDCPNTSCTNAGAFDSACESLGCGNCGFGFCMP